MPYCSDRASILGDEGRVQLAQVQVGMVLIPPTGEMPQLSPIARLGLG